MGWLFIFSLFLVGCNGSNPVTNDRALSFFEACKKTTWQGYDQYEFFVESRTCKLVVPPKMALAKPWIWRARFFGHEPQTDLALLDRGFCVAYMDVSDMFGSPDAVKYWNRFYSVMVNQVGLSKKPVLEGMSRGGLIIYNWAAMNPEKVSCIYADAPVCDIKSWPGGKGAGRGGADDWQKCLRAYKMTEEEALKAKCNPIDKLQPLAKANVPLLHVVGDADDIVPVKENTAIIEQRYKKLGGTIKVIHKPGIGHHPHSLKDPEPIVNFILKNTNINH